MEKVFTALEMSAELLKVAFKQEFVLHEGLKECAKLVEKSAKKSIGNYQDAAGPFPAWAPLKESTLAEKTRLGYSPPDNPLLRTGELRDSYSNKVDGLSAEVGSADIRALWFEAGTSRMVMRPVLGPAAFRNKKKIQKIIGIACISGFYNGKKIYESKTNEE